MSGRYLHGYVIFCGLQRLRRSQSFMVGQPTTVLNMSAFSQNWGNRNDRRMKFATQDDQLAVSQSVTGVLIRKTHLQSDQAIRKPLLV